VGRRAGSVIQSGIRANQEQFGGRDRHGHRSAHGPAWQWQQPFPDANGKHGDRLSEDKGATAGVPGTLADNAGTGNVYVKGADISPNATNSNGRSSIWYVLSAGAVTTSNAITYTPVGSTFVSMAAISSTMKVGAGVAAGAAGLGGAAYFDPENFQRHAAELGAGLLGAKLGGAALKSNVLSNMLLRGSQRAPLGRNALQIMVGPRVGALMNRPIEATAR
jgi:hypothetical protein